jgi:hypothetical protein
VAEAATKKARKPLTPIREPLSVGLFQCQRCGAALYEMPGDLKWCRYFECRSCEATFHFEGGGSRRKKRRRLPGPREKPHFEFKLVPGRRERSEVMW